MGAAWHLTRFDLDVCGECAQPLDECESCGGSRPPPVGFWGNCLECWSSETILVLKVTPRSPSQRRRPTAAAWDAEKQDGGA